MRPDRRKLIRKALEHHAPMSDAQLCWLMVHFGLKPATTRGLRYRMTRAGEIRAVDNKVQRTAKGRLVNLWELAPKQRSEAMQIDPNYFAVARIATGVIVYSGFKIEKASRAYVVGTVMGTGQTQAEAEANAQERAVEARRTK